MNLSNKNTVIGILGGMGPFASAHFHQLLINRFINKKDLPEIIIDSISIEDFVSDSSKIPIAKRILSKRVKQLSDMGVTTFAITCNTAHILHPFLSRQTSANFPNLIDIVSQKVLKIRVKNVLLLTTPNTVKHSLFHQRFKNSNVNILNPSKTDTNKIEKIIHNRVLGILKPSDNQILEQIIQSNQSTEAVILGCTELSLSKLNVSIPVFDTLEILADHLANRC